MHRTHTKHRAFVRYLLGACAASLCAAVIFVHFGIQSPAMESPEVKFADTSESGLSIVPASCPSFPHYGGECDPGTCTISSSPQSIMYGQGSTISWSHQGYVTGPWGGGPIDGWSVTAIGSIDNGIGGVGQSGATGVAPGSSVTYTYSGTYYYIYPWFGTWFPLASFSCSTPVYVSYYPATCSVWFDANPIEYGGGTTLRWNSSYADHWLYINNVGNVGGSGAIGVSPTVSTDYSCYAYGLGASDGWHGATLYVNQPPPASCSVSLSPTTVNQGSSSYLSWSSSNAHYWTYINNVGYVGGSDGTWVTPGSSTDYSCYPYGVSGSYGWVGATLTVYQPCALPWGGSTANGTSVTAYQSSTVPWNTSCVGESRSCSNGSLSGSYTYQSCSVTPPVNCSINGTTIAHGSTQTLYSSQIAPIGQACSSITQSRTCTNGTLSGSDTYQYSACTCAPLYSCSGNTIMYTSTNCSTTAYAPASPSCPSPSSCVPGQSSCIYPNITYGTLNGVSGQITARPIVVPEGEPTKLYWNVENAQSCTVSGGGQTWALSSSGSGGQPTAPITQRTVYTLSCTGYPNTTPTTVSGTVIVNLLPTFRER